MIDELSGIEEEEKELFEQELEPVNQSLNGVQHFRSHAARMSGDLNEISAQSYS